MRSSFGEFESLEESIRAVEDLHAFVGDKAQWFLFINFFYILFSSSSLKFFFFFFFFFFFKSIGLLPDIHIYIL